MHPLLKSMIYNENLTFKDTRCPENKILNGAPLSVCYTLIKDDITKGKKPWGTPYIDRADEFVVENNRYIGKKTNTSLEISPFIDGIRLSICSDRNDLSEFGINLPFNFMGKLNGGGWENQYLFNSPYTSTDKGIIYAYLTNPKGNNLCVCVLSDADGWKMDYSTYLWSHYFVNLQILCNYDKVFGTAPRNKKLEIGIFPVSNFDDCLSKLSLAYGVPFLDYKVGGGKMGDTVSLISYGEPDALIEITDKGERILPYSDRYILESEGDITLIPAKNGKLGGDVSLYGYKSLLELYKKSMDSVDLHIIKARTNANLCEHECWASAMLRLLLNHKDMLSHKDITTYETKIKHLLNVITETDENKAVPEVTILNKPHGRFKAYNVFKSARVQELAFGITILLDAYKYFGDEKYLEYLIGATDCYISNYQKEDGHIEVVWDDGSREDYTTVCCPMIPICDMANFLKDKDKKMAERCKDSAHRMAEFLYHRGMKFPTEGGKSDKAEEEMEDGSISCTALALLYYTSNIEYKEEYVKKAKEILDIHESWVIKTPRCQMHGSSLRWWETQWEGDADGPAICAGHGWSIWRAEADYLYYALTRDDNYRIKAENGFLTNLSKIRLDGTTYAIYNPDEINGGGFHSNVEETTLKIAKRYASYPDCGLSRYVWIRLNDTFLK